MVPASRPRVPDEAIVVRGGTLGDQQAAADSAEDAELHIGVYGLSVECFCVASVDEALRATRRPHPQVRLSTAGRIRDAGLEVIPTGGSPHGTLCLPKPLDAPAWARVQAVFDPPMPNLYATRRA